MSQTLLYPNTEESTALVHPYFVTFQANDNKPRWAIPVAPVESLDKTLPLYCPVVCIEEEDFAVLTDKMIELPSECLQNPVSEFNSYRDVIMDAIDLFLMELGSSAKGSARTEI